MKITIWISEQCKEKNFYATEYAAELYEQLIREYPSAQINFTFVRESNAFYNEKDYYITNFNTAIEEERNKVGSICKTVCQSLIQKNILRKLNSATGEILPVNFKNFITLEEISNYLKEKGVRLFTYG